MKYKKAAILGFGIEGKDAAKFLLSHGVQVSVFDRKPESELDFTGIDKNGIEIITGSDYLKKGLSGFDVIVRSPGIYRYIPELVEAEKGGVEVTSAIKLFFDLCPAKIIGVTGTKGKGTTCSLIYEMFKSDDRDVYLAGNIGKPCLELLDRLDKKSWVVVELSSFQLIDLTKSPHIAVVLNITLDHLDWHKNREEYIEAKKNIVKYQKEADPSVINEEYVTSRDFAKYTKGEVVFFSKEKLETGFRKGLLLRGDHNLENIAAAIAVARIIKIPNEKILKTISSFRGLEHRLELVGIKDGIYYYNDSFSTNPQPTMAAVESFTEPITLILGGSDKGLSYDELGRYLSGKINVKTVVLIGQIAPLIERSLVGNKYKGKLINLGMTTMKKVVDVAGSETPKGGVVLLSPGTASFGMFKDYKDRGCQFKSCVDNL